MNQTAINFNKPQPHELFKAGTQDERLYSRLLVAPITNAEIVDELRIFSYTRRVSDLREKLKPYLMDVKAERVRNGLFIYTLK
jgi:hypothetical protein